MRRVLIPVPVALLVLVLAGSLSLLHAQEEGTMERAAAMAESALTDTALVDTAFVDTTAVDTTAVDSIAAIEEEEPPPPPRRGFAQSGLVEFFNKGGRFMWGLLALSIVGVAVIIERAITLQKAKADVRSLMEKVVGALKKGKLEDAIEVWEQVIGINLTGVWLCMKYELRQMLTQGRGAIVNTASVMGLVSTPTNLAYAASKHGVVGLTKSAALAYAQAGIRVNAVCPAFIHSPMTERIFTRYPERQAPLIARHPMGRLGLPDEIAAAVVWLCSDAASFVTGHTLTVDGGYVAQ